MRTIKTPAIEVLTSQKVLSGSGHAGRLRLMGKYIDHCLIARPELDNTFRDGSTRKRDENTHVNEIH